MDKALNPPITNLSTHIHSDMFVGKTIYLKGHLKRMTTKSISVKGHLRRVTTQSPILQEIPELLTIEEI